jgi:hypothetical protein
MNFCLTLALCAVFQLSAHGGAEYRCDWILVSTTCLRSKDTQFSIGHALSSEVVFREHQLIFVPYNKASTAGSRNHPAPLNGAP